MQNGTVVKAKFRTGSPSTRQYGMTGSLSYRRRARARDTAAEAACDSRVDTAHKAELHVAMLVPDATSPVTWTVRNEAHAVERLRRKLERAAPESVWCCYESGPVRLRVAATARTGPGPLPGDRAGVGTARKPGERIKTDRRDARKLAELYRAGLLTVVQAPTAAEEAVRDLCRARDDARADRQRCSATGSIVAEAG